MPDRMPLLRVVRIVLGASMVGGCVPEAPSGPDMHAESSPPSPPPRVTPAQAPAAVPSVPPSNERPKAPTEALARGVADALRVMQSAACLAHSRSDSRAAQAVHRWIDAAGITHYSDQPPPAGAKEHRIVAAATASPVRVEASGADVALPALLQQRAAADALGIQRILHDLLGIARPDGMTLKIVFVKSPETYARLVGEPELAQSSGAYSTADRTIHVRSQGDDEFDLGVLRHEITHALVHETIGNLPVAINEGLAEYFGGYHSVGMGGQIDVGARRVELLKAVPADAGDAMVDLLAREGSGFYANAADAHERDRRYLQAYALIAVLMRDAPGQRALRTVLDSQAAAPCVPIAAESVLDASYPGGLARLSAEWIAFMRAPPTDVRAY